MKRIISRAAAILLCAIFAAGGTGIRLYAANFRDVGPNQAWARDAINAVSAAGIMTADLQGNFNPANPVSKFDTVRILARMSGFNPDMLSPQQAAYHNAVFEARRGTIEAVSGRFDSWNNATDREIAFLLYSGVLIPSDLQNFIVMHEGQERLRALTREEAAVFMVRFMGRTQEALRNIGVPAFRDDNLIAPGARPHVYFLRHLGIMVGDGTGNVNPRDMATRATMAILVYDVLNEMQSPVIGHAPPETPAAAVETITGTIANTYPSFRSILTTSQNAAHNNRIFPIAQAAIITIGGLNASFGDLSRDMNFTATLNGGEIVAINVIAAANRQDAPQPAQPEETQPAAERQILDGTVAAVNIAANTISIETRMLNPRGEVITNVREYTVAADAAITRGGAPANLAGIAVGDLVVAAVYGNQARKLTLEERMRQISGTLAEKNFAANSLFPLLVVQDENGRNHSFETTADSVIYRFGMGNIPPRSLRIGDTIDVTAEFGRVTQASAAGAASFVDVYIRDIFISYREQSHVVVSERLYGTPDSLHLIIDGAIDVYALTVGSRVRLWLDSQEVSNFELLAASAVGGFAGHVTHVGPSQISVRDANFNTRVFAHDNNTIFFNSVTGLPVHVGELFPGMRVQVVADAANSGRVAAMTVLS
ncbi:MAG: S-layer homology domain-containing protein [Clostridiales bacterium]|jgi:hypothetical protein|nr:S-layer homology domain-containing protein [Clostridiales bacterium]